MTDLEPNALRDVPASANDGDAAPRSDAPKLEARVEDAFEIVSGAADATMLLLADHASNRLPEGYPPALGLPPQEFERHIAYDIGVEGVTRRLATLLNAPLVLSRFSRLLIDPNRGADDPTLIMRLSDGAIVPTNHPMSTEERERRVAGYWQPYDRAVRDAIDTIRERTGLPPLIVSVHSFTPFWRGVARPWQVGVLWDGDDRVARPLIEALASDPDLTVGNNEPYDGALDGDMMNRQAHRCGLPHALIEIRQDLIASEEGQQEWAERLAPLFAKLDAMPGIHEVRRYPSRTDPRSDAVLEQNR